MQASSATVETSFTLSGCGSSRSFSAIVPPSIAGSAGPLTASTARSSSAISSATVPVSAPSRLALKLTVSVPSSRASSTMASVAVTVSCPAGSTTLAEGRTQSSVSRAVASVPAVTVKVRFVA